MEKVTKRNVVICNTSALECLHFREITRLVLILGIYRVPNKLSGVTANSLDDEYLSDKRVSEINNSQIRFN